MFDAFGGLHDFGGFFPHLRGPAAILFILRDTCSDCITKPFVLVLWGIEQLSHHTLQKGVSHRCACAQLSIKEGGGIAPFWGAPNLPQKVSCAMGYRSDSIAISCDMGSVSPTQLQQITA